MHSVCVFRIRSEDRGSYTVIIAPHGDFHITSHRFDEPLALDLVGRSFTAVAIHRRKDAGTATVRLKPVSFDWMNVFTAHNGAAFLKNKAFIMRGEANSTRYAPSDRATDLRDAGYGAALNRRMPGAHETKCPVCYSGWKPPIKWLNPTIAPTPMAASVTGPDHASVAKAVTPCPIEQPIAITPPTPIMAAPPT